VQTIPIGPSVGTPPTWGLVSVTEMLLMDGLWIAVEEVPANPPRSTTCAEAGTTANAMIAKHKKEVFVVVSLYYDESRLVEERSPDLLVPNRVILANVEYSVFPKN